MKYNGLLADSELMAKKAAECEAKLAELKSEIAFIIGDIDLGANASTAAFKNYLYKDLGLPVLKTTAKFQEAADDEVLILLVYGDSDDRVEFEGALTAEGHINPLVKNPSGVLVLSADGKLLDEDSDLYAEYIKNNRNIINVFYCSKDGLNWVFETDIPHETFLTYDGGYDEEFADIDDGFARCMVFEVSSLKS